MTKKEIMQKMLLRPREITLAEGVYNKKNNAVIGQKTDSFSYLFSLAGIKTVKSGEEIEGVKYVIIGEFNGEITVPQFRGLEAYSLKIAKDYVVMSATDIKGIDNAIKCYIRLQSEFDSIPCMEIEDMPDTKFRGVHMCIFDPKDGTAKEDTSLESIKKLIKTAAMSGYNHAIIEFWGMFPYERNPFACWSHSDYTMEKVRELIDFAIDDMHITPVPCQNMTSHAGWSRISSRRHVSLDQRKDLEDMWVPGGWCFAVTNPKTQQFLKDCMEELIAAFRNPPFFHASCDKCFGFASTEEERTKPADTLFAAHISNLNTFLQERGIRMVMWSDMIYSSADSLYWKPDKRIADILPKNILMNIWTHNTVGDHWYDVEFYQSRGYETIYSPFINKESITQMNNLRYNNGSLGILQTTWHKPQTAAPFVAYNAACQWRHGEEVCDDVKDKFIERWYR